MLLKIRAFQHPSMIIRDEKAEYLILILMIF